MRKPHTKVCQSELFMIPNIPFVHNVNIFAVEYQWQRNAITKVQFPACAETRTYNSAK